MTAIINSPYFDKYGLVHPEKNKSSENGILFRAILDNWDRLNNHLYWPKYQNAVGSTIISKNRFQANPPQNGDHFSRDNMIGLYALCKIHGLKSILKQLPLVYWNGKINWHPNTYLIFLAFKYPIFKYNPVIYIMALYSLLASDYKNTSGKNLWFLTLTILDVKWPLIMAQKRFKKHSALSGYNLFEYSNKWYFSGQMKFDNADHPILKASEYYYKTFEEF